MAEILTLTSRKYHKILRFNSGNARTRISMAHDDVPLSSRRQNVATVGAQAECNLTVKPIIYFSRYDASHNITVVLTSSTVIVKIFLIFSSYKEQQVDNL